MPGMNPGDYEPRQDTPPIIPPTNQPVSPYPPTAPIPYQYPPQQIVVVAPPPRPTSGHATASMVLGIIGVTVCLCFTFGIPSILAVILGHMAMADIKKTNKGGHGQAVAGLVTGYIGAAPAVILSFWLILGGAVGALTPTPSPTP